MPNWINGDSPSNAELINKLLSKRILQEGHWIWKGALDSYGYGMINLGNRYIGVHRLSAHLFLHLDLSSNTLALHKKKCSMKACFNPEHLYLGNHIDNMRDLIETKGHYHLKQTHCPKGHEYTPENISINRSARTCKICNRERSRICREKKNVSSLG